VPLKEGCCRVPRLLLKVIDAETLANLARTEHLLRLSSLKSGIMMGSTTRALFSHLLVVKKSVLLNCEAFMRGDDKSRILLVLLL